MAPIKLKIKTNSKSFNPFTQLDTEDELSQTWRVCTKVKDSLENGSRYENLAWRLWFMHNVNAQSKKLPNSSTTTTTHSSRKEKKIGSTNNENNSATFLQQQQQQQQQLEEHQEQLQLYDTQPHPVRKNIQQRRKVGKKATSSTVQKKQKQQHQYDQYQYQQQQQQQQHVPPPQHQHQQEMAPQLVSPNTLPPDPHVATTTTTAVPESSIQRQQMVPPSLAPCSVPDPMMLPQQQQQDNQQTSLMNDPSYYQDFVLPQFSSDQDINQTISLQDSDIFGDMLMHLDNNNWMNTVSLHTMNDPSTNNNNIIDPSSSSHTYTNNNNNHTTTATPDFWCNNNPMMMQPQPQQQQQQQQQNNNDMKNALYISEECIAPIPHQTLYNKILSIVPQDKLVSSVERVMEQQTPQLQLQQQLQQQHDSSQKPVMATPSEGKQAICSNCETTQTPLWRRSANDELLCNACGLYAKLHKAPRPRYFENSPTGSQDEGTRIVCSNCATTTTPLWRRDADGEPLCNACGLYLKLHHSKRPLSMKTDVIKKRQRTGDVGIPKGIRMINHQFNQLSTTTTPTVSQEHLQEQQQFSSSSSSSSTNTNNGDINSNSFHNYTFQQVSSPQ